MPRTYVQVPYEEEVILVACKEKIILGIAHKDNPAHDETLANLGWEVQEITPWQKQLFQAAIAQAIESGLPAHACSTYHTALCHPNLNLLAVQPLESAGEEVLVDGLRGQVFADKYIRHLAEYYGWIPVPALQPDDDPSDVTNEALNYLNTYAVAPGYEIAFDSGDLFLRPLDTEEV